MEAVTGTVTFYDRKTGEGLIALDGETEQVRVDFISSAGIRLEEGTRVEFARIHRPLGIFASRIKLISAY